VVRSGHHSGAWVVVERLHGNSELVLSQGGVRNEDPSYPILLIFIGDFPHDNSFK
jgi:hypothetical protein